MTREQALAAAERPEASVRLTGIERLADIGKMADADRLVARLADADPRCALWRRRPCGASGVAPETPRSTALFARGIEQMKASAFDDAVAVFSEIVSRKPEFAEGWNKRATLYFLLGQNEKSLQDCDEVLKRNPNHFGALAGAGQIHLKLGNPQLALEFFRRAVKVNPNLDSIQQMIPILEQHLRDKGRVTT